MSIYTYKAVAEIARGRLNLPTSAKLRIQKNIGNALQVFAERIASDPNKRKILLTPRTVTGTPTNGILDLATLVTNNSIMVDRLQQGRLYSPLALTFLPAALSIANNTITIAGNALQNGNRVQFTTTGSLSGTGISLATNYYVLVTDESAGIFEIYTDPTDPTTIVDIVGQGSGIHTVTVQSGAGDIPMQYLANPQFTSFPINFADTITDKYWWLIGNFLYAFDGGQQPINTAIQFNSPHVPALSEFGNAVALEQVFDELIDALVEVTAKAEASREAQ